MTDSPAPVGIEELALLSQHVAISAIVLSRQELTQGKTDTSMAG